MLSMPMGRNAEAVIVRVGSSEWNGAGKQHGTAPKRPRKKLEENDLASFYALAFLYTAGFYNSTVACSR